MEKKMQIMTLKATTRGTFGVHVKLFHMIETFYLSSFFKCFFNYTCLFKRYDEPNLPRLSLF